MKGLAKNPIYFSAYPLKAIKSAEAETHKSSQSPYLRSILSAGRSKNTNRVRVFPMVNPYKNPYKEEVPAAPIRLSSVTKLPEDIEFTEKSWFHNYE